MNTCRFSLKTKKAWGEAVFCAKGNGMWYVIQVLGGKEQATLNMLEHFVDEGILKEAFIPKRETKRRADGVWVVVTETLFPGYVFVVTREPEVLFQKLKNVPAFTRMLGKNDRKFTPLLSQEVALLKEFGGPKHVVGMSHGVIEGDSVRIDEGPLQGHEGIVKKIDRHKRAAYVEMSVMGRAKLVKLGLEVVGKRV